MLEPAKREATYQDVLDAPENQVAELLDGALFLQPRPAKPHAEAASVLGMLIGPPFRLGRGGPGGWWIQYEPELHFATDVLVPDLAGRRKEAMPELDLERAYYEEAPDWVCEVLSPETAGKDRVKKLPKYARAGVRHAWIIDPHAETLEAYRNEKARWSLIFTHEGGGLVRSEPFDAVELDLGALWLPTTP
ncbi:MAG: Uma2 family endonuclease [Myxococcales bacterium]|nr:Uma2 family endonuclease [Myxococcales bacterium]